MTKDELTAMTDKALQIKAAELMGAQWYAYGKVRSLEFWRPFRWHRAVGDESLGEGWDANIPDYPNDIAAAWELVEKIIKQHKNFTLSRDANAWYVEMDWLSGCDVGSLAYYDTRAKYDSAPRAITRAFILAMEAEK